MKALHTATAQRVLSQVEFRCCPKCETPVEGRRFSEDCCSLCGQIPAPTPAFEELASEFDERADELRDLISRQKAEVLTQEARVASLGKKKLELDLQLDQQAERYDAGFLARLRELEREIAEVTEREKQLKRLQRIPASLSKFTRDAGELQGEIDAARKGIEEETRRLRNAQT